MTRAEIEQELAQKVQEHAKAIANANAIWGVVQYLNAKLAAMPTDTRIIVPGPGDPIPTDEQLKKTRS